MERASFPGEESRQESKMGAGRESMPESRQGTRRESRQESGQGSSRAPRPRPGPDLRLFEDWMDTTKWILDRTARFPKRLRSSLSTRVESLAIGILEDVTTAAYRGRKKRLLQRADERLSRLRVLLRLGHEHQILSHGQYEEAAVRLDSAGRMLGAWLRRQGEVEGKGQ